MQNIPDLYVLEKSIDTPIGQCHFIKAKDYDLLIKYQGLLSIDKSTILMEILDYIQNEQVPKELYETINNMTLFEIIKNNVFGLNTLFKEFFKFLFHDDVFDKIESQEEFEKYRKLICDMNCIEHEKPNDNAELAYFDKLARIAKERKGEIVTIKSMITSVGLYRYDVLEMSIYNLHAYFDRISNFKNYDTVTLFKTVSTEPLEAKPWYIDTSVKKTELDENDFEFIEGNINKIKDNPTKKGIINDI